MLFACEEDKSVILWVIRHNIDVYHCNDIPRDNTIILCYYWLGVLPGAVVICFRYVGGNTLKKFKITSLYFGLPIGKFQVLGGVFYGVFNFTLSRSDRNLFGYGHCFIIIT